MKLKKIAAYIIALSMIVGLFFTLPSSALTPVSGYVEEIIADESFDDASYDSAVISVENGSIQGGSLNFELLGKSALSLNTSLNINTAKQYIIDFEMAVDAEYKDPWSAAFIGIKSVRSGSKPWGGNNGTWLGITKDKLILWHSFEDSKWGMDTAKEGTNYLTIENGFDVSDAAYRIIYEGSVAELYIDENKDGEYTLLATVSKDNGKGMLTVGDKALASVKTFAETQPSVYFSLCTAKTSDSDSTENDPLAPEPKNSNSSAEPLAESGYSGGGSMGGVTATAPSVSLVKIGSFTAKLYKDLLMTDEQRASLATNLDKINEVVSKFGTEDRVYYDSSVNLSAFYLLAEKIEALLSKENALSSEYDELFAEISAVFAECVDQATVDAYLASFDGYISALESIEGNPKYSQQDIDDARALIDSAKSLVGTDVLSGSVMDEAYNKVVAKILSMGVYTKDGIPTYSNSFTDSSYSYSKFSSEWLEHGSNQALVPVSSEHGAEVKLDWDWNAMRFMMQFKKSYANYSVQATITRISSGMFAMSVRQPLGEDTYEEDLQNPALCGGDNSVFIANNQGDMAKVYIGVRKMVRGSGATIEYISRSMISVDLTKIPGALSNSNNTATFLIKDMEDVIEFYVVTPDDNVRVATIYFNPEMEGSCYTKGTLVDNLTGDEQEFSGVTIPKASASVINFSSRHARFGVKDFKINTNVLPAEDRLTIDGKTDPNSVKLESEDGSFDILAGTEKKFTFNADFDALKFYGKDEYTSGNLDVRNMNAASITTSVGKGIIDVDSLLGTITAVRRGTEVLKGTYLAKNGVYTDAKLVNVEDASYTAPSESNVLNSRAVSAEIVNAEAFRSLDEGVTAIPAIKYTQPNGETSYLSSENYVLFKSSDDEIISYDTASGRFVAKKAGLAQVWAEVPYTAGATSSEVITPKVTVEVTEAGTMTPGISFKGASLDLLEKAKNSDVTPGEYKDYIEDAIAAGMDISYGTTDDEKLINAILIRNEMAELSSDASEEEIKKAVNRALAVREVYDVITSDESNADDLRDILFKGSNNTNKLGIDISDFNDLSATRASRAILRVYTQLQKEDVEALSISKIKKIMDTIVESVAEGGGASGGGVSNDTKKGLGNTVFVAPSTPASNNTNVPILSGDEAVKQAEKFTDIESASWAKEAIGALAYEGVVSGYEDGTIRPNNEITRDEFVKLLVCALSFDVDANAVNTYSDIQAGAWQVPYVMAASKAGVVTGTGALTFGSGETITRQDMATMIYRAVLKLKITLPTDNIVAFKDAEMISGYALEAVNKLSAAGVISGMGNDSYAPGACATRAQAISMLYNVRSLMK